MEMEMFGVGCDPRVPQCFVKWLFQKVILWVCVHVYVCGCVGVSVYMCVVILNAGYFLPVDYLSVPDFH